MPDTGGGRAVFVLGGRGGWRCRGGKGGDSLRGVVPKEAEIRPGLVAWGWRANVKMAESGARCYGVYGLKI